MKRRRKEISQPYAISERSVDVCKLQNDCSKLALTSEYMGSTWDRDGIQVSSLFEVYIRQHSTIISVASPSQL